MKNTRLVVGAFAVAAFFGATSVTLDKKTLVLLPPKPQTLSTPFHNPDSATRTASLAWTAALVNSNTRDSALYTSSTTTMLPPDNF